MSGTGTADTKLIVLRGNSASGKSATAIQIRQRFGRGIAIVAQDAIRRDILKDRDKPGAPNIGMIDSVARYALDHGYHVIVEGILRADHYGEMLSALDRDHRGTSHFFYFDVSFAETLRRHTTKRQAVEYGEAEMQGWYRPIDLLDDIPEHCIPESTTLKEAIDLVMRLAELPARPFG